MNEDINDTDSMFETLQTKDVLIIALLLISIIMSIYNCVVNSKDVSRYCGNDSKSKYLSISREMSDTELSEMND